MDGVDQARRKYITAGMAVGLAASAIVPKRASAQTDVVDGVAMLRSGDFSSYDSLELLYHTQLGDAGGGSFYKDAFDIITPDNGGVVIVDGAGNRFKRVHANIIYSEWFSPVGTPSQVTGALANFFRYIIENSYTGIIKGGKYIINNYLVHTNVGCSFKVFSSGGKVIFDYDQNGAAIDFLISSQETLDCEISDIRINANSRIACPVNIRSSSTFNGGQIRIARVHVHDVFQVSQTTSPCGIQVIGEFNQVRVEDCTVYNVGRTNSNLACTGIGISDFAGVATVSGCDIRNIATPDNKDADGLKIFGTDVSNVSAFLGARAVIQNNVFSNCQGRSIKLQISDALISGNQFKLVNQTTISDGSIVDCQADNGNIVDNTVKILGTIPVGVSFSIFSLQNIRNNHDKVSFVSNNRIYTDTVIPYFCKLLARYHRCGIQIHHNQIDGNLVSKFFRFKVESLNDLVQAKITIIENTFPSGWKLLNFYDDIDFGEKLLLDVRDNNNTNLGLLAVTLDESLVGFACKYFVISNNTNFSDRINWPFDMNHVSKGNCFYTGSQVVVNAPSGVDTYFHVISQGFVQKCIRYSDSREYRRTTHNGNSWYAWV